MSAAQTPDDHGQIAVGLGTAIAHKIAEVMPAIDQNLREGVDRHGLTANIMFRLGRQGESVVVAELEFSMSTGDRSEFQLAPSPISGQLAIHTPPQPVMQPGPDTKVAPGMNGGYHPQLAPTGNQYPSAQAVPLTQAPPPLQPRTPLPPPNTGGQVLTPPPDSAVAGPLPQYLGDPAQMGALQQQVAPIQIPPGLNPQQQAAYMQAMGVQVPAPHAPPKPARLVRPPMAGDQGIR